VLGSRVLYGTRSGQYRQVVDAGDKVKVDLPNLVEGTTYFFVVTAYNASGEGPPSEELTHTPNPAMFLNMSTRANVQTGDAVVISGFIIGGSSLKTVIIRAFGPSLAVAGIVGALADPAIELHGAEGLIAENDNWRRNDPDVLIRLGLAPADDLEAELVAPLPPGTYTVIVSSRDGSSGIALLEIYDGGIPVAP